MKQSLYKQIASALSARTNCIKSNNTEWLNKWEDKLTEYNDSLPHGSGIDSGCTINLDKSSSKKIVIDFSFHFMDDNGYYNGWKDYKLTLYPDFVNGFEMYISGSNRDDLKEYFYQTFDYILREEVE